MWKSGTEPLAYLAGAIENAPDGGQKWREEISRFLQQELKHAVFNPCLEEKHLLTPEEFQKFRQWKTTDLLRFRKVVHRIIHNDITMLLQRVDYIICLWDEHVLAGGGTQGELTMAFWQKIPVYMVTKIPLIQISSWIIGCTGEIFQDFDSLKIFLKSRFPRNI
jgi:hypothetical protein